MYCQLNKFVLWFEKNLALWLIIDVRSRQGRQRTICLKTGKATNRGYVIPIPKLEKDPTDPGKVSQHFLDRRFMNRLFLDQLNLALSAKTCLRNCSLDTYLYRYSPIELRNNYKRYSTTDFVWCCAELCNHWH